MAKRKLRISGLKDYIAVDIVNDKDVILSTPFYLTYRGHGKLKYKDMGVSLLTNVFIAPDFDKLLAKDSEGFEFDFPFSELLENHIQFV